MRLLPLPPILRTAAFTCGFLAAAAGTSSAAVLYNIVSFDSNDATVPGSTTVQYDPGLVTVVTAAGLTGTTALQLFSLQTLNATATTGGGTLRFQNTDIDVAQSNGTLISDVGAVDGSNYFQFGISGGGGVMTLTDLAFNAKKATGNTTAVRGYSVTASINGGAYQPLGAANLTLDRNTANVFDNVSLSLAAAQFQNIESINFRVNSTGGGIEFANFTINGAVPEPSSWLLCLAGLAVAVGIRRRD